MSSLPKTSSGDRHTSVTLKANENEYPTFGKRSYVVDFDSTTGSLKSNSMARNVPPVHAPLNNIHFSLFYGDDFLPRTPTPLEHIFGSMFCLPCLLCGVCMRDTFVSEEKKLKDPRRLYAPGRMYHIIERKSCRCGRFPPEVRTAIPVEGRFEYIVLSCNAIFDHSLVWIEREAEKALERMQENVDVSTPPRQQTMEREHSLRKEHADAIQRSEILHLLHPMEPEQASSEDDDSAMSGNQCESISRSGSQSSGRSDSNDEMIENLLDKVYLKQNKKDPVPVS